MEKYMKKTEAQKNSKNFEKLSMDIINLIFKDVPVEIHKTNDSKDGGYDAVVELYDDKKCLKRIYFECKLRTKNLNLRDIAANLIIAFNEGAVALVILTNTSYTKQTNENFKSFYDKTMLNIKVLTGDEIQQIVCENNIEIHDDLKKILKCKKTLGNKEYNIFKLDWSRADFLLQLLNKQYFDDLEQTTFITNVFQNEFDSAIRNIKQGNILLIRSALGTGKTSFIQAIIRKLNCHGIHIIADMYTSQSQLLLGILLDIWGIPMPSLVQEFSDNTVQNISHVIEKNQIDSSHAKQAGLIIRHILGKTTTENISNEFFNDVVCSYIINIINHHPEVHYIFHIEKFNSATEEIQILLLYMCKQFKEHKIGCILEEDIIEYQLQENSGSLFFEKQKYWLEAYKIELHFLDAKQSALFIDIMLPDFPQGIKKEILECAGYRLLTLSNITSFAREIYKESGDYKVVFRYIKKFPAKELPISLEIIIQYYYQKCSKILFYLFLCNFKIPLELSGIIFKNNEIEIVDDMFKMGILSFDDQNIRVTNQITRAIIEDMVNKNYLMLKMHAEKLKELVGEELYTKSIYVDIAVNILLVCKNNEQALELLNSYLLFAKKHRHYTELLKCVDTIIPIWDSLEHTKKLDILTESLETRNIKKEITSEESEKQIQLFNQILENVTTEEKSVYQIKYDYFLAIRLFENCEFSKSRELSEIYYCKKTLCTNTNINNYIAYLNVIYSLSIKEMYGNEKAMECFDKIILVYPNSLEVQREYYSHIGCMNFYKNPTKSMDCFNKIIKLFDNVREEYYPLPFHEYVDRCMSAVCAKQFDDAKRYCEDALKIIESNGVIGELGRIYNIKGCLALCENNQVEAELCFKEASFLVDINAYPLYGWRFYLNYAVLLSKNDCIKESTIYLDKAYNIFKDIYREKLWKLSQMDDFSITREYFALLLFIHTYKHNKCNKIKQVIADFRLESLEEQIFKHVKQLSDGRYKKVYFQDSAYATGKYLFMLA